MKRTRRRFILFGATGSIGDSTLAVLRKYPDQFELVAFTYHNNASKANQIAKEFACEQYFSTEDQAAVVESTRRLLDIEHDFVVMAVVGAAGIKLTVEAALRSDKILLANKESLVIAGELLKSLGYPGKNVLLPVDSEHSSLFRLWQLNKNEKITALWLTASGGPLREWSFEAIQRATKHAVLNHPTWQMGQKITVDSAGLVNKALEIIEAHFLFQLSYEKIHAVIHPQSFVHSMVEAFDGTFFQHVSTPDMQHPIAYAMFYPEPSPPTVRTVSPPEFPAFQYFPVDLSKFVGFRLGLEAGIRGRYFPALFNAANEVAVEAFLKEEILFGEIAQIIEHCLTSCTTEFDVTNLEDLLRADAHARMIARKKIYAV